MSSSSAEYGALKQIALLAGSDSSTEEIVRLMIDVAQRVAGDVALSLNNGGPAPSDGKDEFLQVVAAQIAIVRERDRLRSDLQGATPGETKHIDEVATIYEISQAINTLELDEALKLITEKASHLMNAQACSLLLKDPETEQLVIEASYGISEDIAKGARVRYGEGIAGKVAQTGEPMLILDVANDSRFAGELIAPRLDVVASLCVPLKDEVGDILGVLSIRRHVPTPPFTQADLRLFCIFANQAALAITNAQLYSRLSSRVQEMAIVSDLLRAISGTLDLDRVLSQIADNIIDVVGFDRCCVYLRDPRSDEFAPSIFRGYTEESPTERFMLGEGVVGLAARERIPIFHRNSRIDADEIVDVHRERQALALPIVVHEECIGAVLVDNETSARPIKPESIELLSTFVSQAGIAIENARLYEAMEQKYAELNVLYEQSRAIGSAYGLENAASLLVDVAMRAVQCDSGVLLLLDERRQELQMQCAGGKCDESLATLESLVPLPEASHAVRRLREALVISPGELKSYGEGDWAFMSDALGHFSSVALMPLIAEDVSVGILLLGRYSDEPFHGSEIKLMSIIVSHAAVVLKNAIRYEERMQEKALELSKLYDFATIISSAASLEEALDSIVSIVTGLVQCDECVIYAVDHERSRAVAKAVRYTREVELLPNEVPLDGESVVAFTIRERTSVVSPNLKRDRFKPLRPKNSPVRSLMSIPLVVQDEVVGALNVHSYSPNQYTEDDVRVLSIIASQSAVIYKELEALSALTSYTDNILSIIAAGVVTLDSEGYALTWNKAAAKVVGLSDEQVVGRHYAEVIADVGITDDDKQSVVRIIDGVFQTGEVYQAYKLCVQGTDGNPRYVNLSASQLVNGSGERLGLVVIFEDVTREIDMEDQFRRMSELASIGQLAASIAHELRNPLSSIKGAAQFLRNEYPEHASIVEFLTIIIDEVNGLSKLTTEFLDFARPLQLELKPVNLNAAVEKTLQLMGVHIAENNVSLAMKLDQDLPNVEADENQICQVLRNVIINALQAMPSGGHITIETKPGANRGAELWVHDNGMGIAPEKLEKIFIPFFTTKTKGTGLGLSVVRKIVENHGGRVVVRSQVSEGTSFGVILPERGVTQIIIPEAETVDRNVSRGGDL
jgi:PAS domain S-box-containing protein